MATLSPEAVSTGAAAAKIIPCAAQQAVVAKLSFERVVPGVSIQPIVIVATPQQVMPRSTKE